MLIQTGPEKDKGNSLLHLYMYLRDFRVQRAFRKGERQAGVTMVRNLCAWCAFCSNESPVAGFVFAVTLSQLSEGPLLYPDRSRGQAGRSSASASFWQLLFLSSSTRVCRAAAASTAVVKAAAGSALQCSVLMQVLYIWPQAAGELHSGRTLRLQAVRLL